MACTNCKKIKLQSCADCDFEVSSDCVNYTVDGVTEMLSETLKDIYNSIECKHKSSKTVQGDYTIIEEDVCKILLLNGDVSVGDAPISYTITLPDSEDFIDKVLVIKDITAEPSPSGEVVWEFNEEIQFCWNPEQSSRYFVDLAWWPHKVVYLAFIKVGVNYQWVCISPSNIGYISNQYTNDDLQEGWLTSGDLDIMVERTGYEVKFRGAIASDGLGVNGSVIFTLPDFYIPKQDMWFGTWFLDISSGNWLQCSIRVFTSGEVTLTIDENVHAILDPVEGIALLSGINYYVKQ